MKLRKKRLIWWVTGVIALLVLLLLITRHGKKQEYTFSTVRVSRGSVSKIITATGTIEALKTVEVGTQVSGEISKIYVDYNSQVKAGQLLAELDRKPLTTALTIAETSLEEAKAEMTYQTATYNRIKTLFDKKLVAESDYDQALYNYEKAKTALKAAQLNYDKAKINLGYSYIYSPIDGIVLSRAVDEGQTVAASFSTPTLFSIANDLTQMQVEASVDEADIGQIKDKQRVDFAVDAFPDNTFTGIVTQIRLEPIVTSNVVTYTVIIEAPNPDKKLMPGMTASISVYVEEANDVLIIPSKALWFNPDETQLAEYFMSIPGNEKPAGNRPDKNFKPQGKGFPSPPAINQENSEEAKNETSEVWLKNGSDIYPVRIQTGIDNDLNVEVISGLNEGDEVIISMNAGTIGNSINNREAASSPFMPKPPSRRNKSK